MDVLSNATPPTTSIDACLSKGFLFGNGLKIIDGSGALLVGGEVFAWRPWSVFNQGQGSRGRGEMVNARGQWGSFGARSKEGEEEVWGLLDLCWPKPGS